MKKGKTLLKEANCIVKYQWALKRKELKDLDYSGLKISF